MKTKMTTSVWLRGLTRVDTDWRNMLRVLQATAVLLILPLTAPAQSPAQGWSNVKALSVGTEVRINLKSRTVQGKMQSATDESIAISSDKGQEMFAMREVARVSLRRKSHRARNALIGLGAGAGIGAGLGAATSCSHCFAFISERGLIGIGAGGLGVLGAIVGALVPSGGWREVYHR
jgi:hypothetical protein